MYFCAHSQTVYAVSVTISASKCSQLIPNTQRFSQNVNQCTFQLFFGFRLFAWHSVLGSSHQFRCQVNGKSFAMWTRCINSALSFVWDRFFWTTTLLWSTICMAYIFLLSYNRYNKDSVNINLDTAYIHWVNTFPAVSICIVRSSRLNRIKSLLQVFMLASNRTLPKKCVVSFRIVLFDSVNFFCYPFTENTITSNWYAIMCL